MWWVVEKMIDQMEEELDDSLKYAECAMKHKDKFPDLSRIYKDLSTQELNHAQMLHTEAAKMMEKHSGEDLDDKIWDWHHKRLVHKIMTAKKMHAEL